MQISKGLIQVLLQDHGSFHGIPSFTPLILGKLPTLLKENGPNVLVLDFQERPDALRLLLSHTLQNHFISVEIEAQTEVGVGGLYM